jgi:hypothetical protein
LTGGTDSSSGERSWTRTLELFAFVCLIALGSTTIVTASWARDYAQPRVTLLGSERGISALVTAGAARVLIVNGTDPAALGNAMSKARHLGLERLDLLIVSGNSAAAGLAPRAIELLKPRSVLAVGGTASLAGSPIVPQKVIDRSTEIELPEGVNIAIEVWPAADGENEDVTWSARIERGGASLYWVSDREDLMLDSLPEDVDVTVIGRGAPADNTPFPRTRTIVVAGESISGPDLRALALDSLGPDVETRRIYAGETVRIDLDAEGIRKVSGSVPAASPASG